MHIESDLKHFCFFDINEKPTFHAEWSATRVSKTDTDSNKTDTDTIFPNYPGYTGNGYTDI